MSKIEVGTLLRTKTRTLENTFGEVLWEVKRTGLPSPEPERKGQMDGVRCVIVSGTGKSARPGFEVQDSEWQILQDEASGITKIFPASEKQRLVGELSKSVGGVSNVSSIEGTGRSPTGAIEV